MLADTRPSTQMDERSPIGPAVGTFLPLGGKNSYIGQLHQGFVSGSARRRHGELRVIRCVGLASGMGHTPFHALAGYAPLAAIEVEFGPCRLAQFSRAGEHIGRELQRASHHDAASIAVDCIQEGAHLLGLDNRRVVVVPGWGQRPRRSAETSRAARPVATA